MSLRKAESTIALPEDLLDAVDAEVLKGHAQNREEFVAIAILNQVAAFERAAIDRKFGSMATDSAYLREAVQISDEFSAADWEALQTGERRS